MLMRQQNMLVHTYPKVMFQLVEYSSTGYSCMPDKARPILFLSCNTCAGAVPHAAAEPDKAQCHHLCQHR